jgi:hypothetical protein
VHAKPDRHGDALHVVAQRHREQQQPRHAHSAGDRLAGVATRALRARSPPRRRARRRGDGRAVQAAVADGRVRKTSRTRRRTSTAADARARRRAPRMPQSTAAPDRVAPRPRRRFGKSMAGGLPERGGPFRPVKSSENPGMSREPAPRPEMQFLSLCIMALGYATESPDEGPQAPHRTERRPFAGLCCCFGTTRTRHRRAHPDFGLPPACAVWQNGLQLLALIREGSDGRRIRQRKPRQFYLLEERLHE